MGQISCISATRFFETFGYILANVIFKNFILIVDRFCMKKIDFYRKWIKIDLLFQEYIFGSIDTLVCLYLRIYFLLPLQLDYLRGGSVRHVRFPGDAISKKSPPALKLLWLPQDYHWLALSNACMIIDTRK